MQFIQKITTYFSGFMLLCFFTSAGLTQPQRLGTLRGQITDELNAIIVGATVTLRSEGGSERTAVTDNDGEYLFGELTPGRYALRVSALGFAVFEQAGIEVFSGRRERLNIRLSVALEKQEVTVSSRKGVGIDPENSLTSRVLRGKDLDALPTGPGGLAAALRVLAVPSTGQRGPQILVNGFSAGRLPPKESIREIRINENPFSAEYFQLGFGRIEIFTKPGTDDFNGQTYFHFNDESLDSRNPFALSRASYQTRYYGGNLSGPIVRKRASFFVDVERQQADENAIINATVLDLNLRVTPLNLAVLTPQRRTSFGPRIDYQLNPNHTLVGRYSYTRFGAQNAGVGDFSLLSQAYNSSNVEHTLQLTETAVLNQSVVNETRFQFVSSRQRRVGDNAQATVQVQEAFTGGGSPEGLFLSDEHRWELQNYTTWVAGRHNLKAGAQLRRVSSLEVSRRDFGGTFTFAGGFAPQLDAQDMLVHNAGGQLVIVPVTSIERYRRTVLFQRLGLTPAEIRALGGGATQFSVAGGDPEARVRQYELGAFVQDDWRLSQKLTLSPGLRYEAQNNLNSNFDFAPRISFAWAPGEGAVSKPKAILRDTVVRGGFGIFYERVGEGLILQDRRFSNGGQRQFVVSQPAVLDLFPNVPAVETLTSSALPQTIFRIADDLRAPYTLQSSLSLERQLPWNFSLAATYINTRTLHVLRSRNISAPLPSNTTDGAVQSDGRQFAPNIGNIYQYESSGIFKQNQLTINLVNSGHDKFSFYVTYILNKARSDTDEADSFPANTYDLRSEYGRSLLDVRHSFYFGGWITAPWGIDLNPLVFARSGAPFNITIGRDLNGDSLFTERPGLATDPNSPDVVVTRFGAFDLDPAVGQAVIPRNFGHGPAYFSTSLRASKTFSFGPEPKMAKTSVPLRQRQGQSISQAKGVEAEERASVADFIGGLILKRRYNLTFAIQVENLFNQTNPGPPVGNLSSPFFGRSSFSTGPYGQGSNSLGNRRVEAQIYLQF